MNDIINLLGLEDKTVKIINVSISETTKIITLEKILYDHYYPSCGCRMYSRGIKTRTVNHPVFQDGFKTVLKLRQRRWLCTVCNLSLADDFKFVDKYSHSTNTTDLLILENMKDLNLSVCHIADKFNVSDTYVHQVFDRYVDMKRLPLSEVICIDEVHTETVSYSKYSLIILDFITGQPIDMLPSRQKRDTSEYFPLSQLKNGKKSNILSPICTTPIWPLLKTTTPMPYALLIPTMSSSGSSTGSISFSSVFRKSMLKGTKGTSKKDWLNICLSEQAGFRTRRIF